MGKRVLGVVFLLAVGPLFLLAADRGFEETLTNQDVVDLLKAKLAKELIVQKIKTSVSQFDMSTRAMINLKSAGVPDDLIALMLTQHQSQRGRTRNRLSLEIQHLASDRKDVRDAAFSKIRRSGKVALPMLRETLAHSREDMRQAAARTLGRLGDKGSLPALRGLLADSVPVVRYAAAEALHSLNDEASLSLARKALMDSLRPLDGYIRLLGYFKDVRSAGFLKLRLLEDDDVATRVQSAWALGQIGFAEGRGGLEHVLLKDRQQDVRREAALALGKLHLPQSLEKLKQACKSDPDSRRECMLAIGEYPPKDAVPFLISTLQHRLTEPEAEAVRSVLRKLTHEDYGNDYARWSMWLQENGQTLQDRSLTGPVMAPKTPDLLPKKPSETLPAAPQREPWRGGGTEKSGEPITLPPAPAMPEVAPVPIDPLPMEDLNRLPEVDLDSQAPPPPPPPVPEAKPIEKEPLPVKTADVAPLETQGTQQRRIWTEETVRSFGENFRNKPIPVEEKAEPKPEPEEEPADSLSSQEPRGDAPPTRFLATAPKEIQPTRPITPDDMGELYAMVPGVVTITLEDENLQPVENDTVAAPAPGPDELAGNRPESFEEIPTPVAVPTPVSTLPSELAAAGASPSEEVGSAPVDLRPPAPPPAEERPGPLVLGEVGDVLPSAPQPKPVDTEYEPRTAREPEPAELIAEEGQEEKDPEDALKAKTEEKLAAATKTPGLTLPEELPADDLELPPVIAQAPKLTEQVLARAAEKMAPEPVAGETDAEAVLDGREPVKAAPEETATTVAEVPDTVNERAKDVETAEADPAVAELPAEKEVVDVEPAREEIAPVESTAVAVVEETPALETPRVTEEATDPVVAVAPEKATVIGAELPVAAPGALVEEVTSIDVSDRNVLANPGLALPAATAPSAVETNTVASTDKNADTDVEEETELAASEPAVEAGAAEEENQVWGRFLRPSRQVVQRRRRAFSTDPYDYE